MPKSQDGPDLLDSAFTPSPFRRSHLGLLESTWSQCGTQQPSLLGDIRARMACVRASGPQVLPMFVLSMSMMMSMSGKFALLQISNMHFNAFPFLSSPLACIMHLSSLRLVPTHRQVFSLFPYRHLLGYHVQVIITIFFYFNLNDISIFFGSKIYILT